MMRALVFLLLASCVVVRVEPARVERVEQGSAAPEPLPVDPCASISIGSTSTGALDWRCMPAGLTSAPDGYDNMPGVGYVPLGEAGSTTP